MVSEPDSTFAVTGEAIVLCVVVRRPCLPFVTLSLLSESAVTFPVEVASCLVAQVEVRVGTLFDSRLHPPSLPVQNHGRYVNANRIGFDLSESPLLTTSVGTVMD